MLRGARRSYLRKVAPRVSDFLFRFPASFPPSGSLSILLLVAVVLAGCASRPPVAGAPPSLPTTTEPQPTPSPAPTPPARPTSAPAVTPPPTRMTPFVPGMFVEEGIASWYGAPFHGRRAADGEIFDMNSFVAAHRTLPFGSIVRVLNLNNGRRSEE